MACARLNPVGCAISPSGPLGRPERVRLEERVAARFGEVLVERLVDPEPIAVHDGGRTVGPRSARSSRERRIGAKASWSSAPATSGASSVALTRSACRPR